MGRSSFLSKAWTAKAAAAAWELRISMPRPCQPYTLLGLERLWGKGRLMDCGSELPEPPRCPYPCVSVWAFAATPQNPGSFRVFQGPPGVQHGSPSVAWFCWASALAGVPHFRASSRMWEDFDQIHQAATPTPPAFSTRQIGHALVYTHHLFSIASTRASQFFPSGKGTQMEPLSKLPELPPRTGVFPTSLH
ncbi:hypothetical protein BGZ57DRAFT_556516 [Hyaloscypha finlandica]|nr:hypothetical protein BGZ57DRAFT_556516 [Hyaloscypha finlandica]